MAARKSFFQVAPVDDDFKRMLEVAVQTKDSVRASSKQNLLLHA
jgi:hypothetical protein